MSLKKICEEIIEAAEKATKRPWSDDGDALSWDGESYARSWVVTALGNWKPDYEPITGSAMCEMQATAEYIVLTANHADKLARAVLVMEEALQIHAKEAGYQSGEGWVEVQSPAGDALAQVEEIFK